MPRDYQGQKAFSRLVAARAVAVAVGEGETADRLSVYTAAGITTRDRHHAAGITTRGMDQAEVIVLAAGITTTREKEVGLLRMAGVKSETTVASVVAVAAVAIHDQGLAGDTTGKDDAV